MTADKLPPTTEQARWAVACAFEAATGIGAPAETKIVLSLSTLARYIDAAVDLREENERLKRLIDNGAAAVTSLSNQRDALRKTLDTFAFLLDGTPGTVLSPDAALARLNDLRTKAAENERLRATSFLAPGDSNVYEALAREKARADAAEWEVARWVAWAKSSRCIYCGTVLPNPLDDEQEEADRVKREHVASCEKHPLRTAEARADTAEKERYAIRERLDACEGEVQLFQPAYDLMNNLRLLAALREVMVESKKRDYTKSLEDDAVDSCFRCHRIAAAAIAEGEKP